MDTKIIAKLIEPVEMYERSGPGGVRFQYLKGGSVIDRLNIVARLRLSVRVLSSVDGTTTVVFKEAFGGSDIKRARVDKSIIDIGNAYKAAFTNALKKAALQFGVGLKSEDEDGVEEEKPPVVRRPPSPEAERFHSRGSVSVVQVKETPKVEVVRDEESERAKKMLSEMMAPKIKETKEVKEVEEDDIPFDVGQKDVKPEPKNNPFVRKDESGEKIVDMQKDAIIKLCSINGVTFENLLISANKEGMIPDEVVGSTIDDVPKTVAPSLIRFLTQAKKGK
jgi:hypothetical protein